MNFVCKWKILKQTIDHKKKKKIHFDSWKESYIHKNIFHSIMFNDLVWCG